jgi:hypothetical protein
MSIVNRVGLHVESREPYCTVQFEWPSLIMRIFIQAVPRTAIIYSKTCKNRPSPRSTDRPPLNRLILQSRLRVLRTRRGKELSLISIHPIAYIYVSQLTSFCARWFIISALSCSTIICSSLYASAHGTPSSSALVLTTQSVLPPMSSPDLTHEVAVLYFEARERRVEAGIMSWRAEMRS